ncbi:MAG: tyrosine-type recombinase/integrase [Clostridia bacterium]|nr:tyrosine-type recombinase/integrase [Clostridia bacterium]
MICKKCKKEIEDDSVYCRYCGKKQIETPRPKTKKRANGTGSVYKLAGRRRKPWAVVISVEGKKILLGTFKTQTEANKRLDSANTNGISSYYDHTLGEMFEILVNLNKERLTKSGLTNYRSGYKYLEIYQNTKMRDIRAAHIQDAINRAQAEGKGYATWKKIQNIASLMCQLAMANDLIDKNYAQLITLPKQKEKTEKPSFSPSQLELMWASWQKDRIITAVLAMCYIGLRVNEFLDLKKENVDLAERVIYAQGSKTEAGKNRIIIIPPVAVPLFEKMMTSESEYLFASPNGKRWEVKNFRDRAFYPALRGFGIDKDAGTDKSNLTPHSCRHTYAYLCVKYGLNPKATMDLMGHTKYSTSTEIYAEATKHDIEFLKREADKIK